jgi:hypothetical protein
MSASEFIIMDYYYSPPGITHPFFIENYAWVDQLLEEKYYNYALTAENADEYLYTDLLTENYAWVDYRLAEMCANNKNEDENIYSILMLAPVTWANYRKNAELEQLEYDFSSDTEISDYSIHVDNFSEDYEEDGESTPYDIDDRSF